MPYTSYIGATIACVAASPATVDAPGFAALSYTTIGEIIEFGEIGDTSNDIPIALLAGRNVHVNGGVDGGEVAFTFAINGSNAGQTILRTNSNTNNVVSFKITDPDGAISYFHSVIANVRDQARNQSNYKGMTGVMRVNSATIRV